MIAHFFVPFLLGWAAPALAGPSAPAAAPPSVRVVLRGLVCTYCAQGFERTLRRHPEVRDVQVRLGAHDAVIEFREGARLTEAQLRQAAREAGLGVASVSETGGA